MKFVLWKSNLNVDSKIDVISEEDWKTVVELTMVPEMEPLTRSLVIKVVMELIEMKKIKLSLEIMSSQLWHLMRYWALKYKRKWTFRFMQNENWYIYTLWNKDTHCLRFYEVNLWVFSIAYHRLNIQLCSCSLLSNKKKIKGF